MGKFDAINTDEAAKTSTREKSSTARTLYTLRVEPDFKERIQRGAFITRKNVSEVAEEALALWEEKHKKLLEQGA